MLIEVAREWPWGLVVLGDPHDREALPSSLSPEGVARTQATIAAKIQHAIDGPATASVDVGTEPSGLLLTYSGEVRLATGDLRLADAANEESQNAVVAPGLYEVRVLVDELEHPCRVHFALRLLGKAPQS